MLDIYWELRPCEETQALYKSKGLTPFDYWKYEIEYLTRSTWAKEPSLPPYLLKKYENIEKIQLDEEDREELTRGFIVDLGMNPMTFAVKF